MASKEKRGEGRAEVEAPQLVGQGGSLQDEEEALASSGDQTPEAFSSSAHAPQCVAGGRGEDCEETSEYFAEVLQLAEAWAGGEEVGLGEEVDLGEEAVLLKSEVMELETQEDMQEQEQKEEMGKQEPKEELEQQQQWHHAEECPEKQKDHQAAPGPRPPLEELQDLQLDLEPVNSRATRAYARLKQKLRQKRKSHLDRRRHVIRGIPGFWAKSFVQHPHLSPIISDQDKDMLSYMIDLEVEECTHPSNFCKIKMFFGNNPFFQNELILKEYLINNSGYWLMYSTPIQWCQDYEREAYIHRHHNSSPNFFSWFTDHSFAGSSRIVEIISKDLWLNPLYYYKKERKLKREQGEQFCGKWRIAKPNSSRTSGQYKNIFEQWHQAS